MPSCHSLPRSAWVQEAIKFADLALKTNPNFKAVRKLRDSIENP